jgi:DNA-binding beta-propeller fold protein YncE
MMKTRLLDRNMIVSLFVVMLLIYRVQGVSYAQDAATVTPGENNTSLIVEFEITLDEGVDENAYQIQLRRKSPQGEWTSKCGVLQRGNRRHIAGDPDVFGRAVYIHSRVIFVRGDYSDDTFRIKAIFADLEPGATYEARYRDTNVSECTENPPSPDPWSHVAEGTTHLVSPARVEFVDANLAKGVRNTLNLDTEGGHIDLLKIPKAALAKLTELDASDREIISLTGLESATQLTDLNLSYNQISNIIPLAPLTELIYLELDHNQISNITPLAPLTELKRLWLWKNQISDISPLAGLPRLGSLSLTSNQISDVTVLTTFASLESLGSILLSGNPITDISPIQKLKRAYPNLRISIDIPVILTDPGGEPDLYVIADGSILQLNLNEINVQEIGPKSFRHYDSDIAIDVIGDKIYWATRDNIQRANLDGTNVQDVVTGLDEPENIAVDVSGGKIYWSIEYGDRIQRANLDGTHVQDVVTGLHSPYGIALDVPGSQIYWMEEDDHRIQRANLDGTNVQDVVTGLDEPENIAIDVSGDKIYWTEGGTRQIQRANLDGSDAHLIVPDLDDAPRGIALDIAGNRIYWADVSQNMIWRANLDGSDVQVVAIGVSNPTAIAVHSGSQIENAEITESTGLKADVNGDGTVNIADLVLVAGALGKTGQNAADVNGDRVVNIADLLLVAGAFGNSAAAPALHLQSLDMLTTAEVKMWLSQAQQLNLTDTTSQRGILFLQQLLTVVTPKETALLANFPNPFNPETWIPYHLAAPSEVKLTIYDVRGFVVRELELGYQPAGFYTTKGRAGYWDGKNAVGEHVSSGVYFYQLEADDTSALRKLVILK